MKKAGGGKKRWGKNQLQKLALQKMRIREDHLKKVKTHAVEPGVSKRDVGSESMFWGTCTTSPVTLDKIY